MKVTQKRNAQTISIQSIASSINIVNPSVNYFMQVWGYSLGSDAACNVAFQNGGGVIGRFQTLAVGTPIIVTPNNLDPIFTIDPNANLVISHPNTQNIGGWVCISNEGDSMAPVFVHAMPVIGVGPYAEYLSGAAGGPGSQRIIAFEPQTSVG